MPDTDRAPDSRPALDAAIEAIDAYVESLRADGSIPALGLAVTDRRGILVDRVYGVAEVANDRPATPDTLFEIGSIGKSFCAAIVMQLVEEGRVALDDPVVRHLPWFMVPRTGGRISVRHLLSHTAGISAGVDGTPEAAFQVWRLRGLPPGSAPGRRFHYSNVGYKALGLMIERLEGRPYPEVLRRRVLEPLGMSATEPAITNDIRGRLAVGYEPARDDVVWTEGDPLLPATWLETETADGAIASTASEMTAFVRMLLAGGGIDRRSGGVMGPGRLVSPESFESMTTPMPAKGGGEYGLGLFAREPDGHRYIGHTGGMVGYIAGMWCEPASGLGAVVLQNGPGHAPNQLCRFLIRVVAAALEGGDPAGTLAALVADSAATEAEAEAETEAGVHAIEADAASSPAAAPPPDPRFQQIVGQYRSHNPWTPSLRVELGAGAPWLRFNAAPDGFDDDQPLIPMARGWFRVGEDRLGPERMRFDTLIDGRMARAWLSGWDYYRMGDR